MDTSVAFRTSGTLDWDWGDLRLRCLRETRRVLGYSCAAEDATQEALIRAWRHRDSCQDPRRPGPWISTIARREALRLAVCHGRDRYFDIPCTAAGSPLLEGGDVEALGALRAAVEHLDPEDRWLVFAHYWQDRACRDLAIDLGCSEATVRVRLFRVRRRLREALAL